MSQIKFNDQAIKDLLNSPSVTADIQRRVDAVKAAANSMYAADGYDGDVIATDRAHGAVWAADQHSRRSCAKHNTLLKALDVGRD